MKDIKSVIIGVLIATCMFLLMGSSKACGCEYGGPGTTRWNPLFVKVVD
tara:strand:+ start:203 stop:349 length:147 start_codon:yes stop_codon:yes gene_type:complete